MCVADDTGLGKSLEVLSAIGYVWLQEPEYVPIIVTTKSALFQWQAEVDRFLRGMTACMVFGDPYRRHEAYEDFFLRHDPARKRLLLLTYDHVMYDMEATVIREKAKSPRRGFLRELKEARAALRAAKARFGERKEAVKERLSHDPWEVQQYGRYLSGALYERPDEAPSEAPSSWTEEHSALVKGIVAHKRSLDASKALADALTAEWAPPKEVPGLIDYVKECRSLNPSAKFMLVMDEVHKLKNHRSQFHLKAQQLALESDRVVGMTATPVENRLMEFWAIFRILVPSLFPKITHFQRDYCHIKMQKVSGGRQVPVVIGYHDLDDFVKKIEPYYLSRKKHEVVEQLPELLSREVDCELSEEQEELYGMAEAGVDELGDGEEDDSSAVLKALTLCQQSADAPGLVLDSEGAPFEGPSSKVEALLDLLDGEAGGQKMIVFSRFEKMVSLVSRVLADRKVRHTRITGKEDSPKLRQKNRESFQDPRSGVDVILITTAGAESLNLQSAEHFVFLDLPWGYGKYIQLVGRMVRIGSTKTTVVAHHFLSRRRDGEKTIDHHVLKALRSKKGLSDKVAGEALRGGLKFTEDDVMLDVLALMRSGGGTRELKERSREAAARAAAKGKRRAEPAKPAPRPEGVVKYVEIDLSDLL